MLITNQKDLESYCASIKNAQFLTIDTEFLREKTYFPKLCLIQISDPDKNAAAIDVLANGIDLAPVYDLFFNPKILKIFHAARQDIEIVYNLTGKIPAPLYDTQIAAMVCGYGESVGYERLVTTVTDQTIDKSSQFTDWSRRPLSDKQVHYALGDVTHLVDIYESLSVQLEKTKRTQWVEQENAVLNAVETYANDPDKAWERIKIRKASPKTLAVVKALATWREKEAQHKDLPKTWIFKDDTLVDMAFQAPKDVKTLSKIRGLGKSYQDEKKAKILLNLIKDAIAQDPKLYPQKTDKKSLGGQYQATLDMLKFLLKINADIHHVAPKLIADKDDLQDLAEKSDGHHKVLTGWRYDVFGKDAQALIRGEINLSLKDGKVVKSKI